MSDRARELEQAYNAGRYARQASRDRNTCPMYGITPDAGELRERWRQGWDDQDSTRRQVTSEGNTSNDRRS